MKSFKSYILIFEAKPIDLVPWCFNQIKKFPRLGTAFLMLNTNQLEDPSKEDYIQELILAHLKAIEIHFFDNEDIDMKYFDWFVKSLYRTTNGLSLGLVIDLGLDRNIYNERGEYIFNGYKEPEFNTWSEALITSLERYQKAAKLKIDSSQFSKWNYHHSLVYNIYEDFPPEAEYCLDISWARNYADAQSIFNMLSVHDDELVSKKDLKKAAKQGSEVVDIVDGYKIIKIKTHGASCMYGAGTKWCTTSRENPGYFKQYMDDGQIYIIIGPENKKWQLWLGNNGGHEFRDEEEDNVYKRDYPELIKALANSKDEKISKRIKEIYGNVEESLPVLDEDRIYDLLVNFIEDVFPRNYLDRYLELIDTGSTEDRLRNYIVNVFGQWIINAEDYGYSGRTREEIDEISQLIYNAVDNYVKISKDRPRI